MAVEHGEVIFSQDPIPSLLQYMDFFETKVQATLLVLVMNLVQHIQDIDDTTEGLLQLDLSDHYPQLLRIHAHILPVV